MDSVLLVSLFSLVKVITEAYIQYYVLKMWPFQNFTINMASKGQYVNSTHMNMNFCLTRSLVLQKTLAGVRAFVFRLEPKVNPWRCRAGRLVFLNLAWVKAYLCEFGAFGGRAAVERRQSAACARLKSRRGKENPSRRQNFP